MNFYTQKSFKSTLIKCTHAHNHQPVLTVIIYTKWYQGEFPHLAESTEWSKTNKAPVWPSNMALVKGLKVNPQNTVLWPRSGGMFLAKKINIPHTVNTCKAVHLYDTFYSGCIVDKNKKRYT